MGAMRRTPHASEYENTYYGEKTSDYGHWERERTGTRNGSNLSTAPTYQMNWVEDNRQMSAPSGPAPEEAPETKEPFEPEEKTEDHKGAEADYDHHFQDGNPWDRTSAVDSYQSAFDRATAAGQDMTAGDYLRERTDDKKGGVNRFTDYLTDHNTLASHESNRASQNAINKAEYEELNPPGLLNPSDLYDRYKGDIDSI